MVDAAIIGGFAACLSTVSFTPQAWKIIKTRDTSSISVGMYFITVAGFITWLIYGILRSEWPIIASNSICLALSGFILVMKLLPEHKKAAVADAINPASGKEGR